VKPTAFFSYSVGFTHPTLLSSDEEARQAAYDLLQLGGMLAADPEREKTSGMIEMQRLFARARERELG
jgi:hypothetical protein